MAGNMTMAQFQVAVVPFVEGTDSFAYPARADNMKMDVDRTAAARKAVALAPDPADEEPKRKTVTTVPSIERTFG